MKEYYIYIMTSPSGTLYVGITNNLQRRVYEHKHGLIEGFTKKYKVSRLVYFEETSMFRAPSLVGKKLKSGVEARKSL